MVGCSCSLLGVQTDTACRSSLASISVQFSYMPLMAELLLMTLHGRFGDVGHGHEFYVVPAG